MQFAEGPANPTPTHDAVWWEAQTRGYDWSKEDRLPTAEFDRILWTGLKGNLPYPTIRGGEKINLCVTAADTDD